jgi:thioredoxin 1
MKATKLALAAALLLVACGAPKPAPASKSDTTAACCGSESTGAVCETLLADSGADSSAAPVRMATDGPPMPRLWDFGSQTCLPCKTMLGILTPMTADYRDRVDIRIVDVYQEKALARQYRIVTIPTQVFIDASGREVFRHVGVFPRDSIEARFSACGFPVVAAPAPTPAPAPALGGT